MLSDKDSEESLSDWEDDWGGGAVMGMKRPELIVKPWQTLLLIDEDRNQSQEALFFGIVGLPAVIDDDDALDSKANGRKSPVKSRTRRGSKITVEDNVTEDSETVLRRTLIEACDVTKPWVQSTFTVVLSLQQLDCMRLRIYCGTILTALSSRLPETSFNPNEPSLLTSSTLVSVQLSCPPPSTNTIPLSTSTPHVLPEISQTCLHSQGSSRLSPSPPFHFEK